MNRSIHLHPLLMLRFIDQQVLCAGTLWLANLHPDQAAVTEPGDYNSSQPVVACPLRPGDLDPTGKPQASRPYHSLGNSAQLQVLERVFPLFCPERKACLLNKVDGKRMLRVRFTLRFCS